MSNSNHKIRGLYLKKFDCKQFNSLYQTGIIWKYNLNNQIILIIEIRFIINKILLFYLNSSFSMSSMLKILVV